MKAAPPKPFNCHDQEQPSWFDRARRAVALVAPVARQASRPISIADIGCGDVKLQQFLNEGGFDYAYAGYDLVPQRSDVVALDIRTASLPRAADMVMMLGVVEYLDNLPQVLSRLSRDVPYLLVSHVVSDYSKYTPDGLLQLGWTNHLSREAFVNLLSASGFVVEAEEMTANARTMLWLCRSQTAKLTP